MRTLALFAALYAADLSAATLRGRVVDATGSVLPGVTVALADTVAVSRPDGTYAVEVSDGTHAVTFRLLDFATVSRTVTVPGTLDVTMVLETTASIVVSGASTFRNLADLESAGSLIGVADTASVGLVTAAQIDLRALSRPGDVLEAVPGLVVSQHSGEGKANQYYLRGFNLDHGTDLATSVAGAPLNMPTHAHGQGYTDANFLIPELISAVQYKKGPYFADEGDFSSAGAVNINYANWLEKPLVSLTGGRFGYQRVLAAGSRTLGQTSMLLGALEVSRSNGPWTRPDDFRKVNALLRFTGGRGGDAFSVTLSGYDGRWSATDQIPGRAVTSGFLSPFGHVDRTNGGETHRYAATAEWQRRGENALTRASAYAMRYGLDLFSNFTYYLDDPENGDQFEQLDERVVSGGRWSRQWTASRFENRVGVDVRHDDIRTVGLYHTRERRRLETIREDSVLQTSAGIYAQTTAQWTSSLRTVTGLRADGYRFDTRTASLLSPKLNVILGPWRNSELYVSAGSGFHSNDARGVATDATPLVRTAGAELGLRSMLIPRWQTTVAVWGLDIGSELVFAGDAGTTEAGRASRRVGVEWTNYWRVAPHVVVDADLAWSRARFRDADPAGTHIPGAVEGVVAAGVSVIDLGRVSGSVRGRWLGPRPLREDNGIRSAASALVTAEVGYQLNARVRLVVEGLNLLDSRASDIDYFYTSRLRGEPLGGIDDVHSHPLEPRSVRVRFETSF